MKYLKSYKIFESNEDNESIDWELIDSAKDLALDNLDEGLTLEFNVDYTKGGGTSNILKGEFSHNKDKLNWNRNFDKNSELDIEYLSYSFYFNRVDNYVDYADKSEELIDTLKVMHPDVTITNDRWANNGPIQALRQHLISDHGLEEDDIYSVMPSGYGHYDASVYEFEGMEFISVTYGEAMNIAKQYVDSLDDQKILNVDLYFRFDCIDEDSLVDSLVDEEYYRQDWRYIDEIEADEEGDMDEDSFNNYIESQKDNIKYDIEDYISMHYGKEGLYDIIKHHLSHNWLDKMTEALVDADGLGHMISGYDGLEHIERYNGVDYHIYRIN